MTETTPKPEPSPRKSDAGPQGEMSFWQTVQSVAASLFGVQSRRNRERDFSRGKPMQFIVVGLIGVVLFIAALVLIVQLLLRQAGL